MRVFKPKYKARDGRRRKAAKWYVEIKGLQGGRRRIPGFPDKPATEALGRRIERLTAHKAAGEPLPLELKKWLEGLPERLADRLDDLGLLDRKRAGARAPLAEHLADYREHLEAKGRTAKHVKNTTSRVEKILDGAGFRFLADVKPSRVEAYLGELKGGGLAVKTANHYLTAFKMFLTWMVKDGRAHTNPVEHMSKANAKADRRRERRALTPDEIRLLLDTAAREPDRDNMDGPTRALTYRLAIETGLRANELRSLTKASFDLGERPTVTVAAKAAKSRREDTIPLRPATAEAVAEHLDGVFTGEPAFPLPAHTARMLRADLAAARRRWVADADTREERTARRDSAFLKAEDDAGRVIDFHALRHTTASLLAASGVHVTVAQKVMRHSTVQLTADLYTHVEREAEEAAVAGLPDFAATGTDGEHVLGACLPKTPTNPCKPSQNMAKCGASEGRARGAVECGESAVSGRKTASSGDIEKSIGSCGRVARHRIANPPTTATI